MAQFGLGKNKQLPSDLMPVDPAEVDMRTFVDSTGQTTPAANPAMGRVTFNPSLQAQLAIQNAQQQRSINPLEIVDRVLDLGVTDALDAARSRRDAPQRKAQLEAMMSGLGLDPREAAIAKLNPEAWSKEVAKRYGPTVAAAGSMIQTGEDVTYAPKTEVAGDSVLVSEGPKVRIAGQRPPSYQEKAIDAQKAAAALLQEKRLAAQIARWGDMSEQGNARIALAQKKSGQGGGAASTPAASTAGPWARYGGNR